MWCLCCTATRLETQVIVAIEIFLGVEHLWFSWRYSNWCLLLVDECEQVKINKFIMIEFSLCATMDWHFDSADREISYGLLQIWPSKVIFDSPCFQN